MRGTATVQMLKRLERGTGKKVYELFDLICGTSTGGMLAVGVGIHKHEPSQGDADVRGPRLANLSKMRSSDRTSSRATRRRSATGSIRCTPLGSRPSRGRDRQQARPDPVRVAGERGVPSTHAAGPDAAARARAHRHTVSCPDQRFRGGHARVRQPGGAYVFRKLRVPRRHGRRRGRGGGGRRRRQTTMTTTTRRTSRTPRGRWAVASTCCGRALRVSRRRITWPLRHRR